MSLDPFLATRPKPTKPESLPSVFSAAIRQLGYFFAHTLRPYEPKPAPPSGLSLQSPSGTFTDTHLRMCERLATQSADRLAKVEQKTTTLLSVISLLAPLSASAAAYMALHFHHGPGRWVFGIEVVAFVCLLLASVATLRALAIREFEDIGVGGLIDQSAVRPPSIDFEIRGLLYETAMRGAVTDHIADFVRAAQVFLWIGIAAQVAAGGLTLSIPREQTQPTEATVHLAPEDMKTLAGAIAREDGLDRRVDSLATVLVKVQKAMAQGRSINSRGRRLSPAAIQEPAK